MGRKRHTRLALGRISGKSTRWTSGCSSDAGNLLQSVTKNRAKNFSPGSSTTASLTTLTRTYKNLFQHGNHSVWLRHRHCHLLKPYECDLYWWSCSEGFFISFAFICFVPESIFLQNTSTHQWSFGKYDLNICQITTISISGCALCFRCAVAGVV